MKYKFLLPALLLCAGWGRAQTTLQVVTKTVQKSVAWKPGYELEITGERADVQVEPSTGNTISVKAELTAKHPNLDTAKYDLQAWKLVVSTVGKKVYIRAYIGLAAKSKVPLSNLKARLTVYVPASCPVNLSNKYGKARLEKLSGAMVLHGEFCQFTLSDLSGAVQVESRHGDIDGRRLSGPVKIQMKWTDMNLSGLGATCDVRSEFGAVRLGATAGAGDVTVHASHSDVTLDLSDPLVHNLQLQSAFGEVVASGNRALDTSGSTPNLQKARLFRSNRSKNIYIQTSFGKITVQ